jgi:hypothetical protein
VTAWRAAADGAAARDGAGVTQPDDVSGSRGRSVLDGG